MTSLLLTAAKHRCGLLSAATRIEEETGNEVSPSTIQAAISAWHAARTPDNYTRAGDYWRVCEASR